MGCGSCICLSYQPNAQYCAFGWYNKRIYIDLNTALKTRALSFTCSLKYVSFLNLPFFLLSPRTSNPYPANVENMVSSE